MSHNPYARKDCPIKYRVAARVFSLVFLATALISGLVSGGHLNYPGSPWQKLPGQVASLFGLAALDIKMTGLEHHEAVDVLTAINVRPGGPLLGFDAKRARETLQRLDWVDSASVTRSFPNQLSIAIVEREPFVVWQYKGALQVVDQKGKPMSGVSLATGHVLLQVVGADANLAAADLINQMEATPELFQEVKAASYIGGRRWNLLMKNNLTIALPELKIAQALQSAQMLYFATTAQRGKVKMLDLRIEGEVAYHAAVAPSVPVADPRITSSIQ
jgi:cell division protein FtsQ